MKHGLSAYAFLSAHYRHALRTNDSPALRVPHNDWINDWKRTYFFTKMIGSAGPRHVLRPGGFCVSGLTGFTATLHRFVACAAKSFAIYPCLFKFVSLFFIVSGVRPPLGEVLGRGPCWSHPPCCPSALSHILHHFVACAAQSFAIYPSLLLLFECRMILLERLDLAFFAQAGAYLTSIPRRGGLEKSRNWFFIPSIGFHGNALQTCMVSAWFALWLLSVSL